MIAKVCYCLDGDGDAHVHLTPKPAIDVDKYEVEVLNMSSISGKDFKSERYKVTDRETKRRLLEGFLEMGKK